MNLTKQQVSTKLQTAKTVDAIKLDADENWDWSIDDDEFPPGKCSKCGWKYKYRWHDNPNLPSTEFIALCIVLILLFYFW